MRSLVMLLGSFLLLPACTARTGASVHAPAPDAAVAAVAPPAVADANDAWPVPERTAAGYPPAVRWGERELSCNGTGLCEWGIFGIDLYDAALYLERRAGDLAAASEPDQRYVLHLHFVRSLTASQLGEAFTAAVRANVGADLGALAAPLQQLCAAMRDVADGSGYTFAGEPGAGLAILRDGALVDRIADEPFRRLFLRLYLGDQPPTKALREGLLGRGR